MARPYSLLRGLMKQYDLTNELLARELKLSPSTVSLKLNGHSAWGSDEMWHIMSLFEEPAYRLHEIFPRDGKNEKRRAAHND